VSNAVLKVVNRDLMTPAAREHWRRQRIQLVREIFEPRIPLPLSAWAEQEFRLSPESSGAPGKIYLDTTPYLREVMDTLTDPLVEQTVFQKPKRCGGTVVGNAWFAHDIAEDPGPMMLVLPTLDMAKAYSKEQLSPMLRDVPCLKGKVKDPRSRSSDNTMLQKMFRGGSLTIGGSNSPSLFRMRTVRNVWGSDIDDPNFVRNPEGDTVSLAWGRAETMSAAKAYWESSPGHALLSRIVPLFAKGDQRELFVPCPHCGFYQVLVWDGIRYKEVTEPVYVCGTPKKGKEPAGGCGQFIPEQLKYRMNLQHEWRAQAPFRGIASFRMNALHSPFPGATWPKLVDQWEEAQTDNLKLQAFVNTVLAEPWEERGGRVHANVLTERCVEYGAEVPLPVRALVMPVDVQHDRLEWKVKGFGPAGSSCLVARGVIMGSPVNEQVWKDLDELRAKAYTRADGKVLRLAATGVDCGDGTFNTEILGYVRRWSGQRVFAIRGASKPNAPPLPKAPSRNNKFRVPVYFLGVNALKSTVFGRLKIGTPGPGYMFFPGWLKGLEAADYFKQLTSESPRKGTKGRIEWYKRPWDRNEAWDLEVYALGLLMIIRQDLTLLRLPWEPWTFGVPAPTLALPAPAEGEDEDPDRPSREARKAQPKKRRPGGYLRDWRG
jgi:phage terminase large subunit GpA-like protein